MRRPVLESSTRDEWASWLAHLAQVDFLTEPPHRTRFTDRLGEVLARARRSRELSGVVLQNADIALCNARDYHRNACQVYSSELRAQTRYCDERRRKIIERLETLTPREREVKKILIAGNANKMIAYTLGTSTRAIETHRASIMEKMDARSLPDLMRMVMEVRGAAEEQRPREPAEPGSEASGRLPVVPAGRN